MAESTVDVIREWQRKAGLYDSSKQRYIDYSNRLRAVTAELQSLIKDIDPVNGMEGRGPRASYEDTVKELYDKMVAGMHINADLIRAGYPELEDGSVYYVLNRLKELPGAMTRKEGRTLFVFHKEA